MKKIKNLILSCIAIETLVFATSPTLAHRRTNTVTSTTDVKTNAITPTTIDTKEQEKKRPYYFDSFFTTSKALKSKYYDPKIEQLVLLHFLNNIFGENPALNKENLFLLHQPDINKKLYLNDKDAKKLKNFMENYDDKTFKAKGFDFKKLKEQCFKIVDLKIEEREKNNEELKNMGKDDGSYLEIAKRQILKNLKEENFKYDAQRSPEHLNDDMERQIKKSFDNEKELIQYGKESLENQIKENEYFIDYYSKIYKKDIENIKKSDFEEMFKCFSINKKSAKNMFRNKDRDKDYGAYAHMTIKFNDNTELSLYCKSLYFKFLKKDTYDFIVKNSDKIRNFEKNNEGLKKYLNRSAGDDDYGVERFEHFYNGITMGGNYECIKDIEKLLIEENFFNKEIDKVSKMTEEDFEKFKESIVNYVKDGIKYLEKEIAGFKEKLKSKDFKNSNNSQLDLENTISSTQDDIKDLERSIEAIKNVKFCEFKLAASALRCTKDMNF